MKSYIIPAAPGTFTLDDDGAMEEAVIAWFVTEDDYGKYGEPIPPCFGHTILLPDGRVADHKGVFDSFDEFRAYKQRQAEAREKAEAEKRATEDAAK
ncbi:MAG: hypothetical protein ACK4MQ_10790 [Hyphomonas sp.]